MLYTVNEVARLTGVTVKTLHHYHKINLLEPCVISDAGYRLYGDEELERLQQILFYRELDFSLKDIKNALENEPSRLTCLINQQELLFARKQRLERLLKTIEESVVLTKKGEVMKKSAMFEGFNKEQWDEALSEQNQYIEQKYGYDITGTQEVDVQKMNDLAKEAQSFNQYVIDALKNKWKVNDTRLQNQIQNHIAYLNKNHMSIDAEAFLAQTKFFLEDDFHRDMLESQQPGFSYYLYIAAEMYAKGR